ncbi:unnamed protein product [Schistosoma margrebowiei]|uniref:Uncharacterized protein n=1 Tax=Schistosoma margrebowiei TaxID=48269 RepID=A0AA85ART3_9TREM|nr:unnamed protein product [Schistosoma margrebowiei]
MLQTIRSNNITPNINFPICCLQVVDHHGNSNNNNNDNNMTINMMNIPLNNIKKQTLNNETIESMYEKANDLLNKMKKRRKVLKNKQTKIQNHDHDCNHVSTATTPNTITTYWLENNEKLFHKNRYGE